MYTQANEFIQSAAPSKGDILIVDDLKENLDILNSVLCEEGYQVRSMMNGQAALDSAQETPPDLILLDIRMPEMDGYETCSVLKKDPRTKHVPVVFISAISDVNSKIKGLQAGAIDYITKPFEIEVLLARVDIYLTIQNLQKKLKDTSEAFESIDRQRAEVEKSIRHDIKGPLLPIINFPGMIKKQSLLTEKQLKFLDRIEEAGHRILKVIEDSD
jgi:two-component system, sensor histidine kinase and response regulator